MTGTSIAEQNRDVIRRLYAASNAGDNDTIDSLITDDVVLVQSGGHAVPGTWNGKPAMMQAMAEVFAALHNTGVDVHEIVADGPTRVIGLVDALGTDTDGNPYAMPIAETFKVRDGKVVEIRPFYWDQIELRRIAGVPAAEGPRDQATARAPLG